MKRGILTAESRDKLVRLAPPLVIERAQMDEALTQLRAVLADAAGRLLG
jgi:acetylornithine/succinyldiaminopimelate/putrescine aminotransferase